MHTQSFPSYLLALEHHSYIRHRYYSKKMLAPYDAGFSLLEAGIGPELEFELELVVAVVSPPIRVGAILRFFFSPPSSLSLSL